MQRHKNEQPHRNFVYIIEKKVGDKWTLDWDFSAFLSYEVPEQCMKDFEKYNKHPDDYRIVMYISEKPHDE